MIQCKVLIDFLADYLNEELPAEQRREFERHLNLCGDCRHYVDDYRKTVHLCKACRCEGEKAPMPQMPDALVQAILEARKKQG